MCVLKPTISPYETEVETFRIYWNSILWRGGITQNLSEFVISKKDPSTHKCEVEAGMFWR